MIATSTMEDKLARMALYRFLGQAYSYPDKAFAQAISGDELWSELRTVAAILGAEIGQFIGQMDGWRQQCERDFSQLLEELQIEFTYLFINAVPKVVAPPYESVYSGRKLLMGPPVSQVLEAYREAGLVISEEYDALPDHISAELEFVCHLSQRELESEDSDETADAESWRQFRTRFLDEHLTQWQGLFTEKIKAGTRHPFYRLLALLTQVTLNTESNPTT